MPVAELADWIDEQSRADVVWYVKRLSGNDTLANKSHQAGPYVPKNLLFRLFPETDQPQAENPDAWFDIYIDSHADHRNVRAVWYNGKVRGANTRDEGRLTNFGGGKSAILDPESTGSLAVFAFILDPSGHAERCHAWVCGHEIEADLIEDKIGPVEPGKHVIWLPVAAPASWSDFFGLLGLMQTAPQRADCLLTAGEIPPQWLVTFPSGAEIVELAVNLSQCHQLDLDKRLMKRRECEFEIFRSVEQSFFMPKIREGFSTIEPFIRTAQSILQSRKSRSGKSLELHAREIFVEEGLTEGAHFVHNPQIEGGKRPDFLFPSKAAYENPGFPRSQLRMLAAKTTCKDRWRQILNEADDIPQKHLLTLQEGVSEGQFAEMHSAGVTLVVPEALHKKYPKPVRPFLVTLETFVAEVRLLGL